MEICGFICSSGYDSAYGAYARQWAIRNRTTCEFGHLLDSEFARASAEPPLICWPVLSPLLNEHGAQRFSVRSKRGDSSYNRYDLGRALSFRRRTARVHEDPPQQMPT